MLQQHMRVVMRQLLQCLAVGTRHNARVCQQSSTVECQHLMVTMQQALQPPPVEQLEQATPKTQHMKTPQPKPTFNPLCCALIRVYPADTQRLHPHRTCSDCSARSMYSTVSRRAQKTGMAPWRAIAPHEAGSASAMKVMARAASSMMSGWCSILSSWTCSWKRLRV